MHLGPNPITGTSNDQVELVEFNKLQTFINPMEIRTKLILKPPGQIQKEANNVTFEPTTSIKKNHYSNITKVKSEEEV